MSTTAQAQIDPDINWRVLESEHFEVIYPEKLKFLAEEYLYQSERSYFLLKDLFGEMTEKTYVVINDNTDSANGWANFLPAPTIMVYPVLPDELSSIANYGSWEFDLMVHEYTHISSFKPSHSFYTPLRWIFGSVVRPNAILPRWFLEGVAVQVESRYSNFGRLRSPGTQSALRAMVRDDTLNSHTLDKINETSIPSYPFGRRPYLFGSLLWQSIINHSDLNAVEKLHQSYSRRLPFLLNTPVEELTGKGLNELLTKIYSQISTLADRQIEMIRSSSSMPSVDLIKKKDAAQALPTVSPNGKHMVYVDSTPFGGTSIQLRSKKGPEKSSFRKAKSKFVRNASGVKRFCWSSDSSRFLFNESSWENGFYFYSDIWVYKLKKKEAKRLTTGERAREACYSPSGKRIVYVKIDASNTSLKMLIDERKEAEIFKPGNFERVSSPLFIDENTILFAWRKASGEQGLYKLRIGDKEPERLLSDFDQVMQLRTTAKGLLFTSAKSGVSNIYFSKPPFVRAKPITNSETGMWTADLDSQTNELLVTESSGFGTQLVAVKPKYRRIPKLNSVVPGALTPKGAQKFFERSQLKFEDSSFWGAEYLRPRYWIPFIFPVEGGMIFQGSVIGQDPLGKNTIFVDGSYDTVTTRTSYGVSYVNRSTPVDWSASYAEFQDYQPTLDTTFTNTFASTGFGFRLPYASFRWRGSLGGRFREAFQPLTDGGTRALRGVGPSAGFSYASGRSADNQDQQTLSQTSFALSHTEFLEQGDNYFFGQTRFSFAKGWASFLPERHSLLFQAKGSYAPNMALSDVIALGDRTLAGNFLVTIINSSFIMRGYPSGAFVGRQLYNASLEYHFPMLDVFKGKSYFPVFFRNLTGAVFVDGISVDGGYYDFDIGGYPRSRVEDTYWSTGLEMHLNTTFAYHLPVSTTLGLYYGFSEEAGGGFIPFLTFGYSGHGGVGTASRPTFMGVSNPRSTLVQ